MSRPAYYDDKEAGWLKNFTAGFLTTCGLLAVGSPCTDEGVRLPLHGAVDNIPAERLLWDMDDEKIWVKAVMRHAQIFAEKLILTRTITCSKKRTRSPSPTKLRTSAARPPRS